jgi:hypothetical protein
VGDYRLKTANNTLRWAVEPATTSVVVGYDPVAAANAQTTWPETDYSTSLISFNAMGQPTYQSVMSLQAANLNSFAGTVGSSCFAMSTDLETSNGVEISGLNAEEQSDIALIANWAAPQGGINSAAGGATAVNTNLEVYSYYDAMVSRPIIFYY